MIFIPIEKIFIKKFLFKIGIWAKDASSLWRSINLYLKQYLVTLTWDISIKKDASTIFINSSQDRNKRIIFIKDFIDNGNFPKTKRGNFYTTY